MKPCARAKPALALVVLSFTWAVTACFSRQLKDSVAPLQQLSVQTTVAFAALTLLSVMTNRNKRILPALTLQSAALLHLRSVFGGVVGVSLYIFANRVAPIANVAWLQAMPLTVIWAFVIFGERIPFRQAVLVLVGFTGVGILVSAETGAGGSWGTGALATIGGNICFSLGLVLSRPLVKSLGEAAASRWNLLLMAGYSTVAALLTEGTITSITSETFFLLLMSGVVVAMNTRLSMYGYAHLPASIATSILALEAVWSPILAAILFAEWPGVYHVIGGIVVVGSALAISRAEHQGS